LVVVSSSTVYGAGAQAPFVEDAPLGVPLSPYGASKRAAEVNAFTWHLTYQVPVVCVRLFSVYGPRLRPDLAMSIFSDCMLRGAPITLYGDGSVLRDFTHVSDICRGLQATLFTPDIEGEAFNLGHNKPIAMREVIRHLEAGLACRAVIQRRASRAEDMPLTHADLTKSQRLLGYQPTVSFNTGCLDFCHWYANTFGHRMNRLAA
jgi:UDP-glucuronate 4-epimerase